MVGCQSLNACEAEGQGMDLGVYFRTARHLRWTQLLWRTRYTWERSRTLRVDASHSAWRETRPPQVRDDFPDVPLFHHPNLDPAATLASLTQGVFHHLNQSRYLGHEQPDWRLGSLTEDRLWTVTLHYHAWAFDLARIIAGGGTVAGDAVACLTHYLSDWIDRCALNTPGTRQLAWNAYAIATRLGWWIRSYHLLRGSHVQAWDDFRPALLRSLWQQASYLCRHLEWDLRGNHLLRDAVGLAWAGRFFAEKAARHWLALATQLALEQTAEQVLADGGHFERSPAYHLHVMEDIITLHFLLEDPVARTCLREAWQRMAEYLTWLRHPDGGIALFNDGGPNATVAPHLMLQMASGFDTGIATTHQGGRYFPDSGMVVWHGEPWSVFFDVGSVGPDYQPGHAHADTLSIECSCRGRRLFVDPGTYSYDNDDRRCYDRSTAAHNTVAVDHQNSSEVWHIFRVGRRAYPLDVSVEITASRMNAVASHNGYDHLPGRPHHTRRLSVHRDGPFSITDRITGRGRHQLEGGFLLAPEWLATPIEGGWNLKNGSDTVRLIVLGPKGLVLTGEQRAYHPEFGAELETTRLIWRTDGYLPVEVTMVASSA
jgi:uncharacterized heparinase superfamily protein